MRLFAAVVILVLASSARGDESFEYSVARRINQSRACHITTGTAMECEYEFMGIRLVLAMDPGNPDDNVFLVRSAPTTKGTFLKFGGRHLCATIGHMGGEPVDVAYVFISPRNGDVYTDWDVPACRVGRGAR